MSDSINPIENAVSEKFTAADLWRLSIDQALAERFVEKQISPLTPAEKAEKLREDIRSGKVECPACASRRYVDQSDDPSVSFQTPQKVAPGQSKSVVLSHEREHVVNEKAKAQKENREVVSSSVSLEYAKCADCGRTYVAGGLTSTVTRANPRQENAEDKRIDVKA